MTLWVTQTVRRFIRRAATPEGGAYKRFRGCALSLILAPTLCVAEAPINPELTEVLAETVGEERWLRFRFLAPEIARDLGQVRFEDVAPEIDRLCQTLIIEYVDEFDLAPDKVAISLSDRPVPFGETDPDATQFFELYSLQDGTCIWEAF